MLFFRGRYASLWGFTKTWLPFVAIMVVGPILWDLDFCSGLGGRYLAASDSMVPGIRMVY